MVHTEPSRRIYPPYRDDGEEQEVPLRLMTADEKIAELMGVVERVRADQSTERYEGPDTSLLKDQLARAEEQSRHLTKEKQVISEILHGDILNVAGALA